MKSSSNAHFGLVVGGLVWSAAHVSAELPPLAPLRGIAYGALPCKSQGCSDLGGIPSEDMVQPSYAPLWGSDGRDDLGVMSRLGANCVRLYHSLGTGDAGDHSLFLDSAYAAGLNVMPGYDANARLGCTDHDCFQVWKQATLEGFQQGFRQGDDWHPAVAALVILNEPDFFGDAQQRVKLMISTLDGILAAEREAGVSPGRVKLSITWSFGMMSSLDGTVSGPGTFGFQDAKAAMLNPGIVDYTPRSTPAQISEAFRTRWINGVNTQAPWDFVKEVIHRDYAEHFAPTPWYVGEYGANGQSLETIRKDMRSMQELAEQDPLFLGAAFFQFQVANWKGGAEMNFGLFSLGEKKLGKISPADCPNCPKMSVYCLNTQLSFLPGSMGCRAAAVAAAWGGSLEHSKGFCDEDVRTECVVPPEPTTVATTSTTRFLQTQRPTTTRTSTTTMTTTTTTSSTTSSTSREGRSDGSYHHDVSSTENAASAASPTRVPWAAVAFLICLVQAVVRPLDV